METNPHSVEMKTIRADALAALHKTRAVEAAVWDLWIERGEARVIEAPRMGDEDLGILEVAVPRGWRDFLYAYPRWKGQNPKIRDSLSEELREMVRAEVAMLIDEIAVGRPDVAAALVEQYSLQNINTPICRNEAQAAYPEPVEVSLKETAKAFARRLLWLADRLPAGGVVPVVEDIGFMVLDEADLEAGTPAKLCKVRRTSNGWTHIN